MRILASVIVLAVACTACAKHNPDSCCTTQVQCDSLGLDQLYPCDSARVCDPSGACVAPQCATSAECTSPDAPICEGQLCVPKCTSDDECVGIAGKPYCASDGVCVGCKDDGQCTVDAPVCDSAARACRGCAADAECVGGVCLEADGKCVAASNVVFVGASGTDAGECTTQAPCLTFGYAMGKVDVTRSVLHLVGGVFSLGASTITINKPVYIDGSPTTLQGPLAGPVFDVVATPVALTRVTVSVSTNQAVSIQGTASLRVHDATITRGIALPNGGTLAVSHSTFSNSRLGGGVNCTNGTVSIDTTMFEASDMTTQNCQVTLKRNRFDEPNGKCFTTNGGTIVIENNLMVVAYELSDCAAVDAAAPGSAVRFNTFVNTSGVASDGTALECDSTSAVSSNIFAYGSMHPHGPSSCATRYSLYDTVALPTTTSGTGNITAARSTFFANDATHDFHLATGSPAIGAGETGQPVTVDYDGAPRPSPAGSKPDIGALEAP